MKIYILIFGIGGLIAWCLLRSGRNVDTVLASFPEGKSVKPLPNTWHVSATGVFPTRSSTVGANETATAAAIRMGGYTGFGFRKEL